LNNPGWVELALANDANISSNKWYSMRLEITGSTVSLFADKALKLKYTFPNGTPKGNIGLCVVGSDALFDDVKVTGVEDYFSVNPKGALAFTWGRLEIKIDGY